MNGIIETWNQYGERFVEFAWPMLWQSSILIVVVLLADLALRGKTRAVVRYSRLIRPVILLPRRLAHHLSPLQLRGVLVHELVHLKRADAWVNCAQTLLQIVYWWHPLLWLANARLRRVREEAVGDAVTLALGEDGSYAPTLLEVARLTLSRARANLGLVGILESRSVLGRRIERLIHSTAPRRTGVSVAALTGIVAFAAVAVPMGEAPSRLPNAGNTKPMPGVRMPPAATNGPRLVFRVPRLGTIGSWSWASAPTSRSASRRAVPFLDYGDPSAFLVRLVSDDQVAFPPGTILPLPQIRVRHDPFQEVGIAAESLQKTVFAENPAAGTDSFRTRTWRLDGVRERMGLDRSDHFKAFCAALDKLLENSGIDIRPPESFVLSDRYSMLMISAPPQKIAVINSLLGDSDRGRQKPPDPIRDRIFKIDPNLLRQRLEAASGHAFVPTAKAITRAFSNLLYRIPIDLRSPETYSYDERTRTLTVRARTRKLNLVGAYVRVLDVAPPERE